MGTGSSMPYPPWGIREDKNDKVTVPECVDRGAGDTGERVRTLTRDYCERETVTRILSILYHPALLVDIQGKGIRSPNFI